VSVLKQQSNNVLLQGTHTVELWSLLLYLNVHFTSMFNYSEQKSTAA